MDEIKEDRLAKIQKIFTKETSAIDPNVEGIDEVDSDIEKKNKRSEKEKKKIKLLTKMNMNPDQKILPQNSNR